MNQTRRRRFGVVCAVALMALGGAVLLSAAQPAAGAANGPTFTIGAPTLAGTAVHVPVRATGSGFSPYDGFSLHVRWDPAVFNLADVDPSGGPFDTAAGAAACIGPNATEYDGDGGGFVLSCSLISENTIQGEALLVTIALSVAGSGCSPIHLVTLGAPDGGDTSTGSYTIDPAGSVPQSNQYSDGAAASDGTMCQPGNTHVDPGLTPAPTLSGQAGEDATSTALAKATPSPNASAAAASTPAASTAIPATAGPDQSTAAASGSTPSSGDQTSAAGSTSSPTNAGTAATTRPQTSAAGSATSASNAKTATASAASNDKKSTSNNNSTVWIIVLVVIAVAGIGAGGGYWYFRRNRAR